MTTAIHTADECFRCGYDLRGIDNARPCPECGLLAERSRRVTDELYDTRPRWLRTLAMGVSVILLSLGIVAAWPFAFAAVSGWVYASFGWPGRSILLWSMFPWLGMDLALVFFVAGVWLLTIREGYPPADRADARLRMWVRVASIAPLAALVLGHMDSWREMRSAYGLGVAPPGWMGYVVIIVATIGCAPLPLLLFHRLRNLAKRARSAHLAEHCMVVGIGTSLSLLYFAVARVLFAHGDEWFGDNWTNRSTACLILSVILATLAFLFALWSIYLLIRFALAFARARKLLREKWKAGDRSTA